MSKPFYLTTPLYYVNDVPHVGHTYTTIIGDAIARYHRLCGNAVCYLTGTDEHGQKIERAAAARGVSAENLTDRNAEVFQQIWLRLGIGYDEFIRTTQPRHHRAVKAIYERIREAGFIYLGEYSGQYCVRCELFVAGEGSACPDCGSPTEFITEQSYFFKLSAFQEKLLNFYRDNPTFVVPQTRMNEVISFVKGGLKDLTISRTSFRWGIPIPDDPDHIFYVWFDALNGYLSGIGFGDEAGSQRFEQLWPAEVQLMGKDILRFHAVYWPAFLMAAGLEPPRQLLVHGWWTIEGQKMSKSVGNFITAEALCEALPNDYIRYFLLREIPLGADGNFSYEGLIGRINSDLANDLGNLCNRTLTMIDNYFEGRIPESAGLESRDEELIRFTKETVELYRDSFDRLQLNKALENVWELISVCNKYIVANEPWNLAKEPAKRERLASVLYNSAEALRIAGVLLSPIVPDGVTAILRQLGSDRTAEQQTLGDLNWGGLEPETPLGTIEVIYPRLDKQEFLRRTAGEAPPQSQPQSSGQSNQPAPEERITIDDFARVEMRVGKVLEAERVPKSDKLLRLIVDIGSEKRQVVAGIAGAYDPAELPGRLVVLVTNLKPARLMGLESNGMIVAASGEGGPVLATFTEPVRVGTRLT